MIAKFIYLFFRRIIYTLLGIWDQGLANTPVPVVVYCYHSISSSSWPFSVSPKKFRWQLAQIKKTRQIVSVSALEKYLTGKLDFAGPVAVITFDEGYQDNLSVSDFLASQKIHPCVFAVALPDRINRAQTYNRLNLLDKSGLLRLKKNGWEIASHSLTHADLAGLSSVAQNREIRDSRIRLQKLLKSPVRYFAYPKGFYNDQIIRLVKSAGYVMAFSMDDNFIGRQSDRFTLSRIGVDSTHSSQEFKYLDSPSVIRFRRLVKSLPGLLPNIVNLIYTRK